MAMIGAEWLKLWRRGFASAALVLSAVFAVAVFLVMLGLHYLNKWNAPAGSGAAVDIFDAVDVGFAALSGVWFVPVVQLALLAVFTESFASEYAHGTWRTLLLRPIPRWRVLVSKGAALLGFLAGLIALVVAVDTLLGLVPFQVGRAVPPGVDAGEVPGFGERLGTLAFGAACYVAAMTPLLGMASLLAVVTRSAALTITFSLIWLISDFAFSFVAPTAAAQLSQPWIEDLGALTIQATRSFCTDYARGLDLLTEEFPRIGGTFAWAGLTFALAVGLFQRQDIE